MNILAIDTTTKIASVSLKIDNKIIEKKIENNITHSEKLLPLIDEILKNNNLNINDIDEYAVLNGPGSFTGIRISLATLKAFQMVTSKKVFSISALEELAIIGFKKNSLNQLPKYVLSLIDAKNNRVYYGLYKIEKKENSIYVNILEQENNDLIDHVISNIYLNHNNLLKNLVVVGNFDNNLYTQILQSNAEYLKNFPKAIQNIYPSTTDVIETMEEINNKQNYTFDTFTLDAHYVRKSQAERVKNESDNK